ncbi:hypothetical protein D3C84_1247490 [compost metagenome]
MALPIVLSPESAYATKNNIKFPGSAAQATAAEASAKTRINDSLATVGNGKVKVDVEAGAIVAAT